MMSSPASRFIDADECENCGGYCCAVADIPFNYLDRARVAKEFGMSVGHVTKHFARLSELDGKPIMLLKFVQPCIFWTCGMCGIHHIKPAACADFGPFKIACSERLLYSIQYYGLLRRGLFNEKFWTGFWLGPEVAELWLGQGYEVAGLW
jgi:hypothetical protein